MKTILNLPTDPYYNLALMEYLLKHHKDTFILVFENANTIIVGRNQNTYEVVNDAFVQTHQTKVIRRISGGGTVYQDIGNINFVYITELKDNLNDFNKFTLPVITLLKTYGVQAEFKGRNDIEVDGYKVSGNAQTAYKNRMMHGGTLLYDLDLDKASDALHVDEEKYSSKGIKSNRARVMNLKPLLSEEIPISVLKAQLLKHILNTENIEAHAYTLTLKDEKHIQTLMKEKYLTWRWNYGLSPKHNSIKQKRFKKGLLSAYMLIQKGCIKEIKFYSDGLNLDNIELVESLLKGTPYEKALVEEKLLEYTTFGVFTKNDILACLFDE